MNTPDNCYLDKGHDGHDLLGPGESCKACGFVAPANEHEAAVDAAGAKLVRDLYPVGWPRCVSCGEPALDGHLTCGRVECNEGRARHG